MKYEQTKMNALIKGRPEKNTEYSELKFTIKYFIYDCLQA